MNLIKLLTILGATFLTACGEDFGAGVSFGGTGNGGDLGLPSPLPRPETKPDIGGETDPPPLPPEDKTSSNFKLQLQAIYPAAIQQNCQGLQRRMHFINPYTQEPIAADSRTHLLEKLNADNLFAIQLEVCNTTSSQVYEYINHCNSPLQFTSRYGIPLETDTPPYTCTDAESIHLYQPNQCKTYIFNVKIPTLVQQWTVRYPTQYSFNSFREQTGRTQCDALEFVLPVKPIKAVQDKLDETEKPDESSIPPSVGGSTPPVVGGTTPPIVGGINPPIGLMPAPIEETRPSVGGVKPPIMATPAPMVGLTAPQ